MGKASRGKRELAKKPGISEAGSAASSGDLKNSELLQKTYVHIFLIIALGFIVYSNTFHSPFQWDDIKHVLDNPVVKDIDNFISSAKGYEYNPRRFVGYLSFALNYHLGGFSVTGYHIVNLLIHIVNALLVYFLVVMTFRTPYFRGSGTSDRGLGRQVLPVSGLPSPVSIHDSLSTTHNSHFIALFTALLFVSHPIQTQAVTYIVQRFASLATMFYLLSLLMYIKGRLASGQSGKPASRKAIELGSFSLSLLFAVLALRTKEIAFTLPVMVVIFEFVFFRSSLKKRLLFLIPIVLIVVIGLITVFSHGKPFDKTISDLDEMTRVQTHMPRFDYLITQIRVVTTYIRLLFLPINQNFDYDYPVERVFFTTPVFLSCLFLLSLFGLAVYFLYRSGQAGKRAVREAGKLAEEDGFHYSLFTIRYLRFIAFGIFWFFITLSIESSVIPIIDVIFEHRVYLPSIGFFMSITAGIYVAAHKLKIEKITIYALVLIVLLFSGAAYARNAVWKSKITLWEDVARKSPYKARPHNNIGMFYSEAGREDKALAEFETAVKLDPDYADAHYNLGTTYSGYGRTDDALREFQTAIRLKPDYADAHNNLGTVYAELGRMDEAVREFQTAVRLKPDHADAHNNLGTAYAKMGRLDDALREYQTALKLKPDHASARNNLEMLNKIAKKQR